MPRVGVLYMGTEDNSAGFERGMRELGYAPGQNVVLEYRYAEGRPDRLPELAAQLVSAKVDVILAAGPGPLAAARQATANIPIVTVSGSDLQFSPDGIARTVSGSTASAITGLVTITLTKDSSWGTW